MKITAVTSPAAAFASPTNQSSHLNKHNSHSGFKTSLKSNLTKTSKPKSKRREPIIASTERFHNELKKIDKEVDGSVGVSSSMWEETIEKKQQLYNNVAKKVESDRRHNETDLAEKVKLLERHLNDPMNKQKKIPSVHSLPEPSKIFVTSRTKEER